MNTTTRILSRLATGIAMAIGVALLLPAGTADANGTLVRPNSCYPKNEWVLARNGAAGPLWALTQGSGHFAEGEIEIPPSPSAILADGRVSWNFAGFVTGNNGADLTQAPGSMWGSLWAKIDWKDPHLPDTTFVADCIAELQLDEGMIEAELEGWVYGFPHERTPRYAVASINASPSEDNPGGVNLHIVFEFGRTCFEQLVVPEGSVDEFEVNVTSDESKNGFVKMSLSEPESDHEFGRAALPWGYPRATFPDPSGTADTWKADRNPCPGVQF